MPGSRGHAPARADPGVRSWAPLLPRLSQGNHRHGKEGKPASSPRTSSLLFSNTSRWTGADCTVSRTFWRRLFNITTNSRDSSLNSGLTS